MPISYFGSNPQGNFDFAVSAQFVSQVAPFEEYGATDYSANDSPGGYDIYFVNCPVIANDDVMSYNQCNIGGFMF